MEVERHENKTDEGFGRNRGFAAVSDRPRPIPKPNGRNRDVSSETSDYEIVDLDGRKGNNELALVCASNFEDSAYYGDSAAGRERERVEGGGVLDQEVDVVGSSEGEAAPKLQKSEDPDATEQSSSYGNTFSASEDETRMSCSDLEVDSQFSTENAGEFGEQPVPDERRRLLRKKKVTAHWTKYISPLTWRCQWLELRMNELRSQAALYDKELAACKREKQLHSKMIELDDSVSRSVPFTSHSRRKRAMRRMKRKRVEDSVDVPSYLSNHIIFSYYENKRSETDYQSVDNDCDDQADDAVRRSDDYEWVINGLNRGRGDSTMENILLNLDGLQSRVLGLKAQLRELISENIRDPSRSGTNFMRDDPHVSYGRSLSCSPPGNILSECELEVPGSAVSSYGDAADINMIECTVGLLSGDAMMRPCQIDDEVLINNHAARDELRNFENVGYGKVKIEEAGKEEAQSCSEDTETTPIIPPAAAAPGPSEQNGQPPVKKPYTGKKRGRKPKRKRRGGGVSGSNSERVQKRRFS